MLSKHCFICRIQWGSAPKTNTPHVRVSRNLTYRSAMFILRVKGRHFHEFKYRRAYLLSMKKPTEPHPHAW
jgi:hypothetical protein